jgi:hypothetical protein
MFSIDNAFCGLALIAELAGNTPKFWIQFNICVKILAATAAPSVAQLACQFRVMIV